MLIFVLCEVLKYNSVNKIVCQHSKAEKKELLPILILYVNQDISFLCASKFRNIMLNA